MNKTKRLIVVEFNELCPSLLQRWMGEGILPNFKKFYDHSISYVTEADSDPPHLEPWVQWYSLHTGLDFEQHQVKNLTDGPRAKFPDIWSVLHKNGKTASSCSSMNVKGFENEGSFFIPDPWSTTEKAYPEKLNKLYRFVSNRVQEYSNKSNKPSFTESLGFLFFCLTHGLKISTLFKIAFLLFEEKVVNPGMAWKKAVVLDWILTDIFKYFWKKTKPEFATFFLNSTAHFQHGYWRYFEPEKFEVKPSKTDVDRYQGAIKFGYCNMDITLGKLLELEDENTTFIFATALSQQPFLKYEGIGGQHFYRPYDIAKFLNHIGVAYENCQPVMTHQFILHFETSEKRQNAMEILTSLHAGEQPVMNVIENVGNSLYIGCQLRQEMPEDLLICFKGLASKNESFFDWFYEIEEIKSGCHHKDGALWFRIGKKKEVSSKIPLRDIFPTILDMLDVDYKPSEGHPFKGQSLMKSW
ncbi:MAG: alkaline phosphatase family protein [Alphaproteobacteria bacterium]|jgi:hypothetical protein|nr:alkaline phosphatase family protein [Alphaproteobacteria bacterium]MBP9876845.1 alkaline phosphatase family protein [Alphaproteobacteria bacterium]